MANVAFVDPEAVLEWCATVALEEGRVQPLNHLLWLVNVLSLDEKFRETGAS